MSATPKRRIKRKLDVLMLFDLNEPTAPEYDFSEYFDEKGGSFHTEGDIFRTLKALGHQVRTHPLYDDIGSLVSRVSQQKPDLIFNLCESFRMDRSREPQVAALLELLEVNYTGVGSEALTLCQDKALAKKILTFHHIKTPRFAQSWRGRPIKSLGALRPPVFVKPVNTESSKGIALAALAQDEKSALERVQFVHTNVGADALVEEYVDGREIYCGIIGGDRLEALPLIELLVGDQPIDAEDAPPGAPRFFTYKAKWDEAYRKKWNIRAGPPPDLDAALTKKCQEVAKRACKMLRVRGYARVDLRLSQSGEVHVIEVNPNPGLAADDEFAQAAALAGMDYETLLDRILDLGLRSQEK